MVPLLTAYPQTKPRKTRGITPSTFDRELRSSPTSDGARIKINIHYYVTMVLTLAQGSGFRLRHHPFSREQELVKLEEVEVARNSRVAVLVSVPPKEFNTWLISHP